MANYLDPKNDLTFKRVFGEHKHLCKSLLNNMLPLFFLTRINENTDEIPPELLENDLTREAVGYMERAAYTKAQLEAYDKFKDIIMTEKSIIGDALKKGREEGETIGLEKVIANGHKAGYTVEIMATMTGLTTEEVRKIIEGL